MWARFLPHRFLLSLRALDLVWHRLAPGSPTPRAEQAGARQVQLLALTLKERFQSRAAFPSFGGSRRTSLGTGPPPVFRVAHVCSSDPGRSFSFLTPQCFSTGAVSLRAELLFTTWGCHACGQLSQLLATTCQSRPGSVTPAPPPPAMESTSSSLTGSCPVPEENTNVIFGPRMPLSCQESDLSSSPEILIRPPRGLVQKPPK